MIAAEKSLGHELHQSSQIEFVLIRLISGKKNPALYTGLLFYKRN